MSNGYQTSGYENGAYKEGPASNGGGSPPSQQGGYNRGNSNWGGNNRNATQGQSGGFRRFNKSPGGFNNAPPRDFVLDPPIVYKPYVGTTSNKNVPDTVKEVARSIAQFLSQNEYTVRTSVFDGLDNMFAEAKHKEIILPWKGFNQSESKLTFTSEEAKWFAKKYFPNHDKVPETVQTFMAKDVRLLMGQNLKSPAQFLITWTEDGCEHARDVKQTTGFTAPLFTIARDLRIPIFNLAKPDAKERLMRFLELNPPSTV